MTKPRTILNTINKNNPLHDWVAQSKKWHFLDNKIKQWLPKTLTQHFQVACIQDSTVFLVADNNLVAARLRMLQLSLLQHIQNDYPQVNNIHVSIQPKQLQKTYVKQVKLDTIARQTLNDMAHQLAHHPNLAAALIKLSHKQTD